MRSAPGGHWVSAWAEQLGKPIDAQVLGGQGEQYVLLLLPFLCVPFWQDSQCPGLIPVQFFLYLPGLQFPQGVQLPEVKPLQSLLYLLVEHEGQGLQVPELEPPQPLLYLPVEQLGQSIQDSEPALEYVPAWHSTCPLLSSFNLYPASTRVQVTPSE